MEWQPFWMYVTCTHPPPCTVVIRFCDCVITQLCVCLPSVHRQENGVCKFAIRRMKGICGISDVLQFASVQDLVHFFTLHSFEIGVELRPMNVTEHYQLQQQQNGSPPTTYSNLQVSDVHYSLVLCIICRTHT